MSAIVSARDLAVSYGGATVLDVDALDVERGETLTLVGHNGSGKSTLLRVLGLLAKPTRGEVRLDGAPVSWRPRDVLASRRRMAEVLQQPLLCRMSVYQNVALGLRFRRVGSREIRRRVDEWLERFRISHLRDRHARNLSGGEAQRTSLARAFVIEPELLILDEPFSALDPPTQDALLADFQGVLSETNTTTLFATHDRTEALALGDRVAVMSGGRIAQIGPPQEIFSRPADEEVARFVGVENLLSGRVTGGEAGAVHIDVGVGTLEIPGRFAVGAAVLACARPEDVALERRDAEEAAAERNVLTGAVARIANLDSQVRVTVDCGVPISLLVTKSAFRELKLDVGSSARVRFSPATTHLIAGKGDVG